MRLASYIDKSLILPNLSPLPKEEMLKQLAQKLSSFKPEINPEELIKNLMKREEENSTGIGQSIAIPHTNSNQIEETIILIGQVPEGMEFEAIDNEAVKIIFLLVSPPQKMGEHIRLLARITRILKSPETVLELIQCKDQETIYSTLINEDSKHV